MSRKKKKSQMLHELISGLERPIIVQHVDGTQYEVGEPYWSGYAGSKRLDTGKSNYILGYYSIDYKLISGKKKQVKK